MSVGSNTGLTARVGFVPRAAAAPVAVSERMRLPLVDALRALASTMIAWHHFSLYPPLANQAMPLAGGVIDWVQAHARAAQVFFVVGGFILARTMSRRHWGVRQLGSFVVQRYCRLGLPYLAAIGIALLVCGLGRGLLGDDVVGAPPTLPQLIAHLFFLQQILGYESVSAGLWFVCISMQLSLLFVFGLLLRDAIAGPSGGTVRKMLSHVPTLLGWALAVASLFYFNLDAERWDMWAVYFFGQFFLGVVVQAALENRRSQIWLAVYVLIMIAAMAFDYRGRLLTTLLTGLILFAGGKYGFMTTWPASRAVSFMGRTSYSLFLIHYPVLIAVAILWAWIGWTDPLAAILGLVFAYVLSIAAAAVFYTHVEAPAARLSHRIS